MEKAELWQKILNQINSGEMPPKDAKRPEARVKAKFLKVSSATMLVAGKALADQQGKITMRRLNRREYRNSIRALFGVNVDVRELSADGGAGEF